MCILIPEQPDHSHLVLQVLITLETVLALLGNSVIVAHPTGNVQIFLPLTLV